MNRWQIWQLSSSFLIAVGSFWKKGARNIIKRFSPTRWTSALPQGTRFSWSLTFLATPRHCLRKDDLRSNWPSNHTSGRHRKIILLTGDKIFKRVISWTPLCLISGSRQRGERWGILSASFSKKHHLGFDVQLNIIRLCKNECQQTWERSKITSRIGKHADALVGPHPTSVGSAVGLPTKFLEDHTEASDLMFGMRPPSSPDAWRKLSDS